MQSKTPVDTNASSLLCFLVSLSRIAVLDDVLEPASVAGAEMLSGLAALDRPESVSLFNRFSSERISAAL